MNILNNPISFNEFFIILKKHCNYSEHTIITYYGYAYDESGILDITYSRFRKKVNLFEKDNLLSRSSKCKGRMIDNIVFPTSFEYIGELKLLEKNYAELLVSIFDNKLTYNIIQMLDDNNYKELSEHFSIGDKLKVTASFRNRENITFFYFPFSKVEKFVQIQSVKEKNPH